MSPNRFDDEGVATLLIDRLERTATGAIMGIYDREYYRDETRGAGWFSGLAPACKTIILINVLVFVAQWVFPDSNLEGLFAAHSKEIFQQGHIWQLLSAAFLHDVHDLFHILWNMLFLWMVGREMESMYGSREFTLMYLTAAVFSTLCWAVVNYVGPDAGHGQMLGASGAVMAVVVLFTLFYPRREVIFIILPIEMRLLLMIYLGRDVLILLQQIHGAQGGESFRTAVTAHLGGAAYGAAYKFADLRWSRLLSRRPRRPFLRVVSSEPRDRVAPLSSGTGRSAAVGSPSRQPSGTFVPEEQLDARLDEVLAKIMREGRGGLTDDDKRVLEEASRRARDRRSDHS